MIAARIYVNGLGYCGENPDEDYVANVGADGWHVPNVGSLNVLEFSENNVKIITGNRLLRSEIDKILRRLSDGVLDVDEIRIVIEKEGSERAIAAETAAGAARGAAAGTAVRRERPSGSE